MNTFSALFYEAMLYMCMQDHIGSSSSSLQPSFQRRGRKFIIATSLQEQVLKRGSR